MSHRKLFLGGLTKSTTTEQLFEVFGRYGLVVDAVVMERNGVPRGFGFVTFKDESSLGLVLADRVKVDGREVDIKRAVPEEEMEFAPTKVFVGGLSQSVDRAALKQHFEKYGDVRDAVVMMDRATGRSRGFGFVRFAQPEAVEACLAVPQLLDGQCVDVKRAQPADTLPPPKYPRSREEAKRQQLPRRGQQEAPVVDTGYTGYELPQMDVMTANWMASILSMQQLSANSGLPFPFYPPAFGDAAFPGMFDPALLHGFPHASQLPTPELPISSKNKLHVDTEMPKNEAPMESSPLGDLSNVLTTALDGKSPQRTRASPQGSPERAGWENGENSQYNSPLKNGGLPFTTDMKTAMKEAGIASLIGSSVFQQ